MLEYTLSAALAQLKFDRTSEGACLFESQSGAPSTGLIHEPTLFVGVSIISFFSDVRFFYALEILLQLRALVRAPLRLFFRHRRSHM